MNGNSLWSGNSNEKCGAHVNGNHECNGCILFVDCVRLWLIYIPTLLAAAARAQIHVQHERALMMTSADVVLIKDRLACCAVYAKSYQRLSCPSIAP